MPKKYLIKFILAASLSASAFYLVWSTDAPGYCKSQKRILPDEEMIAIAVQHEVDRGVMKIEKSAQAIRAFQTTHPSCCHVDRMPNSLIERRFGIDTAEVRLLYDPDEAASKKNSSEDGYSLVRIKIHACGRVEAITDGRVEKRSISTAMPPPQ